MKKAKSKAGTQNAEILEYFLNHHLPGFHAMPNMVVVWSEMATHKHPQRAINTLTNEGWLIKTDNKRKGIYGELNYTWKYNTKPVNNENR